MRLSGNAPKIPPRRAALHCQALPAASWHRALAEPVGVRCVKSAQTGGPMPNETNKEGSQSCPPGGNASTDSSITRPPQIVIAAAVAAAAGALLGALIGTRLAR